MAEAWKQVARGSRFRHIVFRSSAGRRRAVNLAPRAAHPFSSADPFSCLPVLPLTEEEDRFVRWLFQEAGVDATAYRHETLRRRLPACLRAVRATTVAQARRQMARDRSSVAVATSAMIIGVTGFFRDAAVFDHLRRSVLPALSGAAREAGGPRVWSAGCSNGEELYSVAMLLSELRMLEGAHLLGTDCRPDALAQARAGCYPPRSLREVPPDWQARYFEPFTAATPAAVADQTFAPVRQIRADLRDRVQWRRADLTQWCEPGMWDLILCRNLGMYFRPEAAARLWAQLELALRPGGFLVLGKAERPVGATYLDPVAPCIYRKDGV